MKIATKAALLSAFVFPGAGHVYLKKYVVGGILISVSLATLYYLLLAIIDKATRVSEMILSGEVRLDALSISQALSEQSLAADNQLLNAATVIIIGCFVVGIGDAYRAGRAHDQGDGPRGN